MFIDDIIELLVFNDTMKALGLEQNISDPAHVKENTLDFNSTQFSNCFDISNTTLHGSISDHCMV